jgi:hypothetical protein
MSRGPAAFSTRTPKVAVDEVIAWRRSMAAIGTTLQDRRIDLTVDIGVTADMNGRVASADSVAFDLSGREPDQNPAVRQ